METPKRLPRFSHTGRRTGLCAYRLSGQGLCPQDAVPERKYCETHLCEFESQLESGRCCWAKMSGGRRFCRKHQAASGAASPQFVNGRTSRFNIVPAALEEAFQRGRSDPERLELTEHIDLFNAKCAELLRNLQAAGGAVSATPPFLELRDAREAEKKAAHGTPAWRQAGARLDALLNSGATSDQSWQQLTQLGELIRRMVETQTKRDEKLGQYVPVEQMQMLARQLAASVRRHVTDRAQLASIFNDMTRLMADGARPTPTATAIERTA